VIHASQWLVSFSAFTLLVSWQEGHRARKKLSPVTKKFSSEKVKERKQRESRMTQVELENSH